MKSIMLAQAMAESSSSSLSSGDFVVKYDIAGICLGSPAITTCFVVRIMEVNASSSGIWLASSKMTASKSYRPYGSSFDTEYTLIMMTGVSCIMESCLYFKSFLTE